MKSLFAALLAFAFAAAAQAGGEAKTFATTLQPGERHEECLRLE